MNRLEKLFETRKKDILAVYFTAGYPKLNGTRATALELANAGADIIEFGMPFSDPLADGPTIQQSSKVAMENGMTIHKLFEQLEGIRNEIQVPMLLMGYLNPVLQFGINEFCEACENVGIDGLILPDLPLEYYSKHFKKAFETHDICPVFLVSPQTSEVRIRELDAQCRGFLYAVSTSATTGGQGGFGASQIQYFRRLAGMNLKNPFLVGFGISDSHAFRTVCKYANGGVVGSALIRALKNGNSVDEFVKRIKGDGTRI